MTSDMQEFLYVVVDTLKKHPDWFGPTVIAMQQGLSDALMDEREKSAAFAYALSAFITEDKQHRRMNKRLYHSMQEALKYLLVFFRGTQFSNVVANLIEEDDNE